MASDVTTEIARLLGRDPICNGRVTMVTVEAIAALVADATAIERERCAVVAQTWGERATTPGPMTVWHAIGINIANDIRKGPTV